jgi:superfamily II DNA or RNA helicase
MGEWVGEIEVYIVKEELLQCNIILRIHNHIETHLLKNENGKAAIHLHNQGEQHYEYFSFFPEEKKAEEKGASESEEKGASAEEKSNPCPQLYDPCTKEPIGSLAELEKRIRDLKQQQNQTPVGLYGLTNKTSNYEFLTTVFINKSISLDDMVSFKLSDGRTTGSDIYEVLCRLFVFFGGIVDVNPRLDGNYHFMQQIESKSLKVYNDSVDALKQMECLATSKMGISDITLVNVKDSKKAKKPDDPYCEVDCNVDTSETVKTYLMSVKWYKKDKSAEHYDLEKLFATAHTQTKPEQNPLDIIVFLKSKKDFQIAHNRSYRQYTQYLAKTFYGWNEDVKPFLQEIRRLIFEQADLTQKTPLEMLTKQYLQSKSKPYLSLQLHQDIIVNSICNKLTESTDDKRYLIGVLPRGGKTYIAGGIIRKYLDDTNPHFFNVFWLTAAPTETLSQVKDDLITRYEDFKDFEFHELVNITKSTKRTNRHSIFFCSTQLLVTSAKSDFIKARKAEMGIVFFDEAHKTGSGSQTKSQIEQFISLYQSEKLPFIFLSATYYNILLDYQIKPSQTFIWDYTDVLSARALATETEQEKAIQVLEGRFGSIVHEVIKRRIENGDTLEIMAKAYIGFPDLYFISADFQEEAKQRFPEEQFYRPDSGFNMGSIFGIKPSTIADVKTAQNTIRGDAYKIFADIKNPKNLISLITPREQFDPEVMEEKGGEPLIKEKGSPIDPTILGRIHKMSSDAKSRFRLDEKPSMLMFMPTGGVGTNIFYLLCAWSSLLMTHTWWRDNYEIACVVSDEKVDDIALQQLLGLQIKSSNGIHIINTNVKSQLLQLERDLHCRPEPKGLLILAGQMLSMGISLPCTDVVFLLNDTKSPDDIIQKMYRALTPSINKTAAFVVDLNPVRTLAALYGYTKASHQSAHSSSEILDIIYDTYTWDQDVFDYRFTKGLDAQPLSFQKRLEGLFQKAEVDSEYRIDEDFGGLEKRLKSNIKKSIDPAFVAKLKGTFSNQKLQSVFKKIGLTDITPHILPSGTLIIKKKLPEPNNPKPNDPKPNDPESKEEKTDKIDVVIENFTETIIDFIKYIAITSSTDDFDKALLEYESNIVNNKGTSLYNNTLTFVKTSTVITGINDDTLSKLLLSVVKDFAYHSSNSIFREMKGKLDKDKLRKDKILQIIHRRLTPRQKQQKDFGEVFTPIELVEEMLSHLPDSIWSNPDLTWLDPASGIGNFPVVIFYKLDEGLKKWETSDVKRRKHIVENMIFMMELQSNNVRIARDIFKSLCTSATPNILTGDSLLVTSAKLKTKQWPEQFDIIVGNPPYQPSQLWEKFIILSSKLIKSNGYIDFIVPTSWTSPTSDSWKILKDKKIIVINSTIGLKRKYFPTIGSTFSYFLVQNKQSDASTIIFYDDNDKVKHFKVNLKEIPFLPKIITEDTLHINDKVLNNKLDGEFIRKDRGGFQTSVNGKYKFPYITFIKSGGIVDIKYLDVQDPRQSDKKVLLFRNGYINPYYDNGENGVGDNIHALKVSSVKEGKEMVLLFKSELYQYIWNINKHSGYNHGSLMNSVFRDVSKINDYTDVGIYTFFHITKQEQQTIKQFLGLKDNKPKEGGSRFRKTRKNYSKAGGM